MLWFIIILFICFKPITEKILHNLKKYQLFFYFTILFLQVFKINMKNKKIINKKRLVQTCLTCKLLNQTQWGQLKNNDFFICSEAQKAPEIKSDRKLPIITSQRVSGHMSLWRHTSDSPWMRRRVARQPSATRVNSTVKIYVREAGKKKIWIFFLNKFCSVGGFTVSWFRD